jgi:hypothetical protein
MADFPEMLLLLPSGQRGWPTVTVDTNILFLRFGGIW